MPANDSPFAIALYIITAASVLVCVYLYWPRRDEDEPQDTVDTVDTVDPQLVARWHTLSRRQQQVARLGARDLTDGEIAHALGIGPRTVQSHMEEARRRLGIRKRGELDAICIRIPPQLDHAPDDSPPADT